MKIGIIGSGTVGYAVGRAFARTNDVIFYDICQERTEKIKTDGFNATNDIRKTLPSDVFFICVPTPTKGNDKIDLSVIKVAIKELAKTLKSKQGYFLIVIKSTVIPSTTEKMITPLFESKSEKMVGADFGMCFNPDFLRDSQAYEDFIRPDRIVIGEFDKKSGDMLEQLYCGFDCTVIRTNMKTAEMSKYANNNFYSTKISFFNELHMMCQPLGIDSELVRKIVQMDKFYASHPWEHGHSFGGKCLPNDISASIAFFDEGKKHNPILLKAVRKVNEQIKMIGKE